MKHINRKKWYLVNGTYLYTLPARYLLPKYKWDFVNAVQVDPPIDWFESQIGRKRDEVIRLNNEITFYQDEIARIMKSRKRDIID